MDGDQGQSQQTARVPFKKCNLFLFPLLSPASSLQTVTSPLPALFLCSTGLAVTLAPRPPCGRLEPSRTPSSP